MVDLSIIVVNWNVAELLRACLNSILTAPVHIVTPDTDVPAESSIPRVEIIVVDSGSTDESPHILRSFPQVRVFALAQNVGFTKGNNIGLYAARGRHLMLLNPDTEIIGNALVILIQYLDTNPSVGVVGPHTLNTDGTTQPTRRRFHTLASALFRINRHGGPEQRATSSILRDYYLTTVPDEAITEVDWVKGSALMVRREVYEQIGGLDEHFVMYYEEVDWCRRAKLAGWQAVYVGTAQIIHHEGKSSAQVPQWRRTYYDQSKMLYFRKHHGIVAGMVLHLGLSIDARWPWMIKGIQSIFLAWSRLQGRVQQSSYKTVHNEA